MPLAGRPGEHAGILAQQFRARRLQRAGHDRPGVSEMTRVSARPIRPPAPATIKRMSAMASPLSAPYSGTAGRSRHHAHCVGTLAGESAYGCGPS